MSLSKLGDTLTNKQKKVRPLFRAWGAAAPGSPEAAVVVPGSWPRLPSQSARIVDGSFPFTLPDQAVEDLSKGIVNKLLHGPMTELRCGGADPAAVSQTLANMELLERMFDLAAELEADTLEAKRG
jgi:hypothetical protein